MDTQSNEFGSKVRDIDEIQKLHDVLETILQDNMPGMRKPTGDIELVMIATFDCLCWILSHPQEGADMFAKNIAGIYKQLDRLGVEMINKRHLPKTPPPGNPSNN